MYIHSDRELMASFGMNYMYILLPLNISHTKRQQTLEAKNNVQHCTRRAPIWGKFQKRTAHDVVLISGNLTSDTWVVSTHGGVLHILDKKCLLPPNKNSQNTKACILNNHWLLTYRKSLWLVGKMWTDGYANIKFCVTCICFGDHTYQLLQSQVVEMLFSCHCQVNCKLCSTSLRQVVFKQLAHVLIITTL